MRTRRILGLKLEPKIKCHITILNILCPFLSVSVLVPALKKFCDLISDNLRHHSLKLHKCTVKPFECDECNTAFATLVRLRVHKKIEHAQASVENPSTPLGYNYKQLHPIAPKPSGKLDELGSPESAETKHAS